MTDSNELLESVKGELNLIDGLPVSEHAEALEAVHRKLDTALSTIDGL